MQMSFKRWERSMGENPSPRIEIVVVNSLNLVTGRLILFTHPAFWTYTK